MVEVDTETERGLVDVLVYYRKVFPLACQCVQCVAVRRNNPYWVDWEAAQRKRALSEQRALGALKVPPPSLDTPKDATTRPKRFWRFW
jgi:hypothetical protein